jgi:hypothetical protein
MDSSFFAPKPDFDSEKLRVYNKELVIKTVAAPRMALKVSSMDIAVFSDYLIYRILLLKGGQFIFAFKFFIEGFMYCLYILRVRVGKVLLCIFPAFFLQKTFFLTH